MSDINKATNTIEKLLYRHRENEEMTWVLPSQKHTILTYEEENAIVTILPILKSLGELTELLKC